MYFGYVLQSMMQENKIYPRGIFASTFMCSSCLSKERMECGRASWAVCANFIQDLSTAESGMAYGSHPAVLLGQLSKAGPF